MFNSFHQDLIDVSANFAVIMEFLLAWLKIIKENGIYVYSR